jgi:ABC-type cobalt transport system substrate-binding protein
VDIKDREAMKKIILLVLVSLICIMPFVGCTTESGGTKEDAVQEIVDAFYNYSSEFLLADDIADGQIDKFTELLQSGNISTLQFTKMSYQITLIHAYTLQYMDSKPEYQILFQLLYKKDTPPNLAWYVPEAETDPEVAQDTYESYLNNYILQHKIAIQQVLGIE